MEPDEDHLLRVAPTPSLPRRLPFFRLGNPQHHYHHQYRRRTTPSIRLGGRRGEWRPRRRRGAFLVRTFRKIRLRCLQLYYFRMLKKLRSFYDAAVWELIAAARAMEQSQIMMESYGAVAFMPVTNLPSGYVR